MDPFLVLRIDWICENPRSFTWRFAPENEKEKNQKLQEKEKVQMLQEKEKNGLFLQEKGLFLQEKEKNQKQHP